MITIPQFGEAVKEIAVELNRSLWHLRQNQGVDGAAGLHVKMPDVVEITAEIVVYEDGEAALISAGVTEQKSDPSETTATTENGATKETRSSKGEQKREGESTNNTKGSTGTSRSGKDERETIYTYDANS